jgi:hypothetical protein
MPIQIARQPHAQLSPIHPIVLSPPFQVQSHRPADNAVRSGCNQLFMQGVPKSAALIHRVHHITPLSFLVHALNQLFAVKLPRRPDSAPLTLHADYHLAQIHIQSQFPYLVALCFFATAC